MSGSTAALIVIPVVLLPVLILWIGVLIYLGDHPEWKAHRLAREAAVRRAAGAAEQVAAPERKQAAGSLAGSETAASPRAA